jgi:tyrosinase
MCSSCQIVLAAPVVELEVNDTTADADDYICWSPMPARIRQVGGGSNLAVVLSSTKRTPGQKNGQVHFATFSATRPTPATFNPQDTLNITLPTSGAWKSFWVAGKESSADGKDVKIIVTDPSNGSKLLELPVMVRIRKNAESLTDVEIERLLTALATLHDVQNSGQHSKYLKYVHVHGEAFFMGIHNVPAFAPWHRLYLLSLERELQAIDPRIALPYWKFDENAPRLFRLEFIGRVSGNSNEVAFSTTNPIRGWKMPSESDIAGMTPTDPIPVSNLPLSRERNGGSSHPDVFPEDVMDKTDYGVMWAFLEGNYHNDAHNHIGDWMASLQSPRDPLFFLLHANVDRQWAEWQKQEAAFNPGTTTAYSPQNGYPGSGAAFHQGSYADDTQWPWNLHGGSQGTADPDDDWPGFTFNLLMGPANHGPSSSPVVKENIDYEDRMGDGFPIGYSYDTIKW